jgi:AcrR family transcriptional regulator
MTDSDPRAPKQARSAWTRERLLDVLCDLLAEQPLEDIRVADIADRAGVTVGAIYGRFDGKNEMVVAAYERYSDDAVKRMESWAENPRWAAEATPREIVASWVHGALTFTGRRLPLVRVSATTGESKIIDAERRIINCSAEKLARLLRPHLPNQNEASLERDLGIGVMACRSMMVNRRSIPTSGRLGFNDAQLREALIDLVLGMVGLSADAPRSQRR